MLIYAIQDIPGKVNLPPIIVNNEVDFFRMLKGLPEDHYFKLYSKDFLFALVGCFDENNLEKPLDFCMPVWKDLSEVYENEV